MRVSLKSGGESHKYELMLPRGHESGAHVVLGLVVLSEGADKVKFLIRDEFSRCLFVPANVCDVIDSRVSRYWALSCTDGGVRVWPKEFEADFFHDDLSEGVPEVKAVFERVCEALIAEAAETA